MDDASQQGVRTVSLAAGDVAASRIYEHGGFRRIGTACIAAPAVPTSPPPPWLALRADERYSGPRTRRTALLVARLITAVVALVVLASISRADCAAAQPVPGHSTVIVAHLDAIVSPITAQYVHRVVGAATDQGAALLVLTIDTPGGLDTSMRQMVRDLLNSPIPSVAFASPSGARVASAGVFVAEAANVLVMAPGTNIGAAHPIQGSGEDIPGDLRDKITNDAAVYIASIAKQRGRNDTWVQDAVRQSVSLDADQAVAQGVADFTASDLSAMLRIVEGRTVSTSSDR